MSAPQNAGGHGRDTAVTRHVIVAVALVLPGHLEMDSEPLAFFDVTDLLHWTSVHCRCQHADTVI